MNLYVWKDIEGGLTNNYHSGGGVLVVADSIEEARKIIKGTAYYSSDKSEWEKAELEKSLAEEPFFSADLVEHMPLEVRCIIFPDAGCC